LVNMSLDSRVRGGKYANDSEQSEAFSAEGRSERGLLDGPT